jgi:hypothetical protein
MVIARSTVSYRGKQSGNKMRATSEARVPIACTLVSAKQFNCHVACRENDVVCGIYINGIRTFLFSLGTYVSHFWQNA